MKPRLNFPYNMLGEIAIQEKEWNVAIKALETSIAIHSLAVAHYYTSDFKKAAEGFHSTAKDSDLIRL